MWLTQYIIFGLIKDRTAVQMIHLYKEGILINVAQWGWYNYDYAFSSVAFWWSN